MISNDDKFYDADGIRIQFEITGGTLTDPLPVFGWASAVARAQHASTVIAGTAATDGITATCTWAPNVLTAGIWYIQVRAGAMEAEARVIFDEPITVRKALVATP